MIYRCTHKITLSVYIIPRLNGSNLRLLYTNALLSVGYTGCVIAVSVLRTCIDGYEVIHCCSNEDAIEKADIIDPVRENL